MSTTVNSAFVTKWEAEAKHEFGQTESYLRNAVKVRNANASTITFHKLAGGTAILDKARHSNLTPMNVAHSTVSLTMGTIHAPELIDDLDAVQTNLDLRSEYTQSVTTAANRALDGKIITALDATGNTVAGNALDKAGLIGLHKQLTANGVPLDGNRYLVTHSGGLEDILSDTTITSRDYAENQALDTGMIKNFLGFNIIVALDDVVTAGSGTHFNYAFHKSAVGLGFAKDFTFQVERLAEKDAWQVMAKMAAGAIIIDDTGVCKKEVTD